MNLLPMPRGQTWHYIKKKWQLHIDVGCPDFDRAEYNRFITTNKLFTTAYVVVETSVAHTPLSQPLAPWIPRGELPVVGKKDWQQYGGGRGGENEPLEFIVVET